MKIKFISSLKQLYFYQNDKDLYFEISKEAYMLPRREFQSLSRMVKTLNAKLECNVRISLSDIL